MNEQLLTTVCFTALNTKKVFTHLTNLLYRMNNYSTHHKFHIPVMGLAYTIDSPIKVARFGISSVISIVEDRLVEMQHLILSTSQSLYMKRITVQNGSPIISIL